MDVDTQWWAVIEETKGGGNGRFWGPTQLYPAGFSREEARQIAGDLAHQHAPEHPMRPKRRRVFRVGDDSWLVTVEGATANFHFRVSVAELISDAPAEPWKSEWD